MVPPDERRPRAPRPGRPHGPVGALKVPSLLRPRPLRAARLLGLALALGVSPAGCSVWRPRPEPGAAEAPAPGPWRVVLRDGRSFVLSRLSVTGDSLVGEELPTAQRRAVARSDVARLERRERDGRRTLRNVWLAWNAFGVFLLIVYVAG